MTTTAEETESVHIISVYVANKPGVLARIAQVFARRGWNIDSLVVSAAVDGRYSRMTITALGKSEGLDQIIKQLNKLIDVIHCREHNEENAVSRELALIKVRVTSEERTELLQITGHFGVKTVDITHNSIMIMATGDSSKVDALIGLLDKYQFVELVRSGKVIMVRGDQET